MTQTRSQACCASTVEITSALTVTFSGMPFPCIKPPVFTNSWHPPHTGKGIGDVLDHGVVILNNMAWKASQAWGSFFLKAFRRYQPCSHFDFRLLTASMVRK